MLVLGIVGVTITLGISKSINKVQLSDLTLANIEALALGEESGKTADACKGEAYIYGAMKRVKDSKQTCIMKNIRNVEKDGICWYK